MSDRLFRAMLLAGIRMIIIRLIAMSDNKFTEDEKKWFASHNRALENTDNIMVLRG